MKYPALLKALFVVLVICNFAFGIQSCKKSKTNQNTTPNNIDSIPYSGCNYVENLITFSLPLSAPNALRTVVWDFGDGNRFNFFNLPLEATHAYTSPGTYTTTLIINNDTAHLWSSTIHIIPYPLVSSYTHLMGGLRPWNGTAQGEILEWFTIYGAPFYGTTPLQLIDTMWAVQILDSGTVSFLDNTGLNLTTVDAVNNLLIFSDCAGGRFLTYYYTKDSMIYTDNHPSPVGHDGYEYFSVHSP